MFVAFVLIIIMGVLLFRTRSQVASLRRRVDMLEGRGHAAPAQAPEVAARPVVAVQPLPPVPEPMRAVPEVMTAPAPPVWTPPVKPAPEPKPVAVPLRERMNFEELFGRRLPIWAGGATLAVAGVLIVKYSIDAGLLSPLVRVIFGLIFGAALIGGGEVALRQEAKVRDARVRQALAGAGVASLYASVLIAANLYHLIGPVTAFVGLAGVTALAMGLSLRFGAPSALLGLVGGLAAPALVGSTEPNVPLLATYLALAIGGLCTLSRTQRWMWLGVGALIGGLGWGAILLFAGALDAASSISLGLFLVLLGIGLPLLIATGKLQTLIRAAAPLVAAVQIAALVAIGGFGLLQWGLFALISVAIIWLSRRDDKLLRLPVIGVVIALLLLGAWPEPLLRDFAIVALALAIIFVMPAVFSLWRQRGSIVEAGQIAAIALGGYAVTLFHYFLVDGSRDHPLALVALAAAALPAGAAALGWRSETRRGDARFVTLSTATALLLATTAALAFPHWSIALSVGLIAAALLLLGLKAEDRRLEYVGWVFGFFALPLLAGGHNGLDEFVRTAGEPGTIELAPALLRWTALALVAALFAWRSRYRAVRAIAQGLSAVLGYAALAQVVPATALPLVPAAALVGVAVIAWQRTAARLLPALVALFGLVVLWAAWPLTVWAGSAYISLVGEPMLASGLPMIRDAILRLAVPALAIGGALWLARARMPVLAWRIAIGAVLVLGAAAAHILFKQMLAMQTYDDFIRLGLIERTIWEALLVAAGIAVRRWRRPIGLGITAAGVAHFAWYTLILHNPLWWDQAVGGVPVISWLLPAYGLPLLLLWLAGRYEPDLATRFHRVRSLAQMVLILMLGASVLRQAFVGTLLTAPGVSEMEDISRSVVAISMAIGFLLWGIRAKSRLWRVASLVLMIVATLKVFLFDASGLDGLARIGSFVALGFSLIGLGWLYSRQLTKDAPLTTSG